MTSNDTRTTTDTSSWDAPAPGRISLGGNPGTDENRDRVGSVVTDRAVVSAPDASAATPGTLLPAAAVGALLVLVADLVGQFATGTRYPVGVVTGVLGAPYLLYLIVRVNRRGSSL